MRLGLLLLLACCVFFLSLGIGTSSIDFTASELIFSIRLPRVLLAALAGSGLAVSGVCFQALLHNPMADPYIVGVSGGAALGGVLAIALGVTHSFMLPGFAFLGGLFSVLLLFGLARATHHHDALTLLLLGVVFNAFAASVVTLIKILVSANKAQEILFWLLGTIDIPPSSMLLALAIYVAVGYSLLQQASGALNLLALGDTYAATLGLPVKKARLFIFVATALLVGAIVSMTGMIGFVGLLVPHVMRRFVGQNHHVLLPASALAGAIFLIVCDTLTRLSFLYFGSEIPVGAITAFTGGPFFLWVLLRRKI